MAIWKKVQSREKVFNKSEMILIVLVWYIAAPVFALVN